MSVGCIQHRRYQVITRLPVIISKAWWVPRDYQNTYTHARTHARTQAHTHRHTHTHQRPYYKFSVNKINIPAHHLCTVHTSTWGYLLVHGYSVYDRSSFLSMRAGRINMQQRALSSSRMCAVSPIETGIFFIYIFLPCNAKQPTIYIFIFLNTDDVVIKASSVLLWSIVWYWMPAEPNEMDLT